MFHHHNIYVFLIIFFSLVSIGLIVLYFVDGYLTRKSVKKQKLIKIRKFVDEVEEKRFKKINHIFIPSTIYIIYAWEESKGDLICWKIIAENEDEKDDIVKEFKDANISVNAYQYYR